MVTAASTPTERLSSYNPATHDLVGTVPIHTGRGTSRAGHLFLGSGRPIWNNDGDSATLIDLNNVAVSRYRY